MSQLFDVRDSNVRNGIGSLCLNKVSAAIGTTTSAVTTGAAVNYTIGGVHYTRAALTNQAITPTHDAFGNPVAVGVPAFVQPANTTTYLLLSANAAGTLAVSQGSYTGQAMAFPSDLSKVVVGSGAIPQEPAGYTAFALIKVVTTAATFTPGTTALTGVATLFDLMAVPGVAP